MRPRLTLPLVALALALGFGPAGTPRGALAQEPPDAPDVEGSAEAGADAAGAGAEAAPAPARPGAEAAFMTPLGRLSTILGSVHFLRTLCAAPDEGVWREKMSALLDAQNPPEADRRRLVSAFNTGYRAYQATYRRCTPAARLAVARLQDEGAELSREISTRFGN